MEATSREIYKAIELADCGRPSLSQDKNGRYDDVGAEWLANVVNEAKEIASESEMYEDGYQEEADSLIPMFTKHLWQVWTSLGGFDFDGNFRDFSSHGDQADSMNRIAQSDCYEWAMNILQGWESNKSRAAHLGNMERLGGLD